MATALGFAGLGCCAAALLFAVLAMALPYWVLLDESFYEIYYGLWRMCIKAPLLSLDHCDDLLDFEVSVANVGLIQSDGNSDTLKAVRAMVTLGLILSIGAMICVSLVLFVLQENKMLGFIGGGLNIASGLFLMIGMAIFADEAKDSKEHFHAGFAFDILGWLANWVAGALVIVTTLKKN